MADERPKYVTFRDLHLINLSAKSSQKPDEKYLDDNRSEHAHKALSDQQSLSAGQSLSVRNANESVPQALSDQQSLSAKPALIPEIAGDTRIPNLILEWLLPQLRIQEQATYLRLYRLSHGFHSDTCRVGLEKLAKACNLSRREIIRSIERLEFLGWVQRLGCNFNSKRNIERGNLYRVTVPMPPSANQTLSDQQSQSASQSLSANPSPNKDDDDLKNYDHHQSETMRFYEELTGNKWKKADDETYLKIKNVPLEMIEQGIRLATQRATSRPNSLAYFVKEITSQTNPSQQSRTRQKKAIERIVNQIRELSTGGNKSFADFAEDVKRACAREGIGFDNDLFNEITSIKSRSTG
jgi:hypothetical protein